MIRFVIEYLRKKHKISVEDLIIDVCSSGMYYKYLRGEKNLSDKKIVLIKDKLGADDLSLEEISEYKKDLDKIIRKFMRYYSSLEELKRDCEPLIELENQLLLCDDLAIDYLLVKMNYLPVSMDFNVINECINILDLLKDQMTELQLFNYTQKKIAYGKISNEQKEELLDKYVNRLENCVSNTDYGIFFTSCGLQYIYLRRRMDAMRMFEKAKVLYTRDMNYTGLIKVINVQAGLYIEQEKFSEALKLLEPNYESCKKFSSKNEMFYCIVQLISIYASYGDIEKMIKYHNKIIKRLNMETDDSLKKWILSQHGLSLITTYSYCQLEKQKNEIISLIKDNNVNVSESLKAVIQLFDIETEEERIVYLEKVVLPVIVGKVYFKYCRWLLSTITEYYENNRMYKKANEIKDRYLEEFKKYYFF